MTFWAGIDEILGTVGDVFTPVLKWVMMQWQYDYTLSAVCRNMMSKRQLHGTFMYYARELWRYINNWVDPWHVQIDGLVQDCSNSSALAMELLQSCAKPSLYCLREIWCHINNWAQTWKPVRCLCTWWYVANLTIFIIFVAVGFTWLRNLLCNSMINCLSLEDTENKYILNDQWSIRMQH